MSVAAWTSRDLAASHTARFRVDIVSTAASSEAPGQRRCFIAVVMIPVPRGFDSTSTSPGRAPWFAQIRSSRTRPVTASPYLGSVSDTECPPARTAPASLTFASPPARTWARISLGRRSLQHRMFSALIGTPPIA